MAGPRVADRIKETSTTTGTGTVTLLGAVTGFRSFSIFSDGDTCYYVIVAVNSSGVPTGAWEVGTGTVGSSGTTLARDGMIFASSNSGSLVNFGAGTKHVFVDLPAGAVAIPTYTGGVADAAVMSMLPIDTDNLDSEASIWIGDPDGDQHEGPEASIVIGGFRNSPTDWGGGYIWASHNGTTGSVLIMPNDANNSGLGGVDIDVKHGGLSAQEATLNEASVSMTITGAPRQLSFQLSQINSNGVFAVDGQPRFSFDIDGLTLEDGYALRTTTTTANTALLQAYDVNGATYRTFGALLSGDVPRLTISQPSGGLLVIIPPTSNPGVSGAIWNNAGTLAVVP